MAGHYSLGYKTQQVPNQWTLFFFFTKRFFYGIIEPRHKKKRERRGGISHNSSSSSWSGEELGWPATYIASNWSSRERERKGERGWCCEQESSYKHSVESNCASRSVSAGRAGSTHLRLHTFSFWNKTRSKLIVIEKWWKKIWNWPRPWPKVWSIARRIRGVAVRLVAIRTGR